MRLLNLLLGREERAGMTEPSWAALGGMNVTGGRAITARAAESLSAVLGCVEAIGGGLAILPPRVYRVTEKGRKEQENHPLMRLVRRGPNAHQVWPDLMSWLAASTMLSGNALIEIISDPRTGELRELRPHAWGNVNVMLLPNGKLAYDVSDINGVYGGTGRMRRLLSDEVIHLRDRSDDGLVGRSRLARAGAVIQAGLSIQEFSSSLYENGVNPTGAFKTEQALTKVQREQIREGLGRLYSGTHNAGKALILEAGTSWQQISITPEDAEMLASRRFSVEEIARIFQVPPPIIGDLTHGTFTNSETLIRFFAQSTLASWCRKIEAAFSRALLPDDDLHLELDLSGLLRGDPETRWKSHEIAVRNKILLPNEIRDLEGWNPREGGDRFEDARAIAGEGNAA
jgi:HK97 family phage portal protein